MQSGLVIEVHEKMSQISLSILEFATAHAHRHAQWEFVKLGMSVGMCSRIFQKWRGRLLN